MIKILIFASLSLLNTALFADEIINNKVYGNRFTTEFKTLTKISMSLYKLHNLRREYKHMQKTADKAKYDKILADLKKTDDQLSNFRIITLRELMSHMDTLKQRDEFINKFQKTDQLLNKYFVNNDYLNSKLKNIKNSSQKNEMFKAYEEILAAQSLLSFSKIQIKKSNKLLVELEKDINRRQAKIKVSDVKDLTVSDSPIEEIEKKFTKLMNQNKDNNSNQLIIGAAYMNAKFTLEIKNAFLALERLLI